MAVGGRWQLRDRAPVAAGLLLVVLVALLKLAGLPLLDRLGLLLFDAYQQAQPRAYQDAPVRIVDIDDESIRRLGQWPWPRSEIARLTDQLGQAGASVIAFDVVFSEPDRTSPARIADRLERDGAEPASLSALRRLPDHDELLSRSFANAPVVLGYFMVNDRNGPPVGVKAGFGVAGSPPTDVPRFRRAIESLPSSLRRPRAAVRSACQRTATVFCVAPPCLCARTNNFSLRSRSKRCGWRKARVRSWSEPATRAARPLARPVG